MSFKPYLNQNYEELKRECLNDRTLFTDPEFDATNDSLYRFNAPAYIARKLNYQVYWKRPTEIVSDPSFFVNNIDPKDLHQGFACGNCWFIAGAVDVATVPKYFKIVIPDDQSFEPNDYCGIFHFRFWQFGHWLDVVIDDRLPVDANNQLLYCSNPKAPNEFWCSLLEKAYAKLSTCYEFMDGGFTQDAIVDMTGGVTEVFDLEQLSRSDMADALWKFIFKAYKMGSLSGAAINKSVPNNGDSRELELPNGLWIGHAYSITKVTEITSDNEHYDVLNSVVSAIEDEASKLRSRFGGFGNAFGNSPTNEKQRLLSFRVPDDTICLLRLRNPWGHHEWKGPWSDSSPEWSRIGSDVKEDLGLVYDSDGEFWISFGDFVQNFNFLDYVHINLHAFSEDFESTRSDASTKWECQQNEGEWVPGQNAGGSAGESFWQNPQYCINIQDVDPDDNENRATLIISLMVQVATELRNRNKGQLMEFPKQFRLFRVKDEYSNQINRHKSSSVKFSTEELERIGSSAAYSLMREVSMRFRLEPGNYVIIPSTYDRNVPGKFLLRLYSETKIDDSNVWSLDEHNSDNEDIRIDPNYKPDEDKLFDQNGEEIPIDDYYKFLLEKDEQDIQTSRSRDFQRVQFGSTRNSFDSYSKKFSKVKHFDDYYRTKENSKKATVVDMTKKCNIM